MKRKQSLLDKLMAESVEMPGFPQIIVTRGWLYQFMRSYGWPESERGFGSLDYTVFSRNAVAHETTEPELRDKWLAECGIIEDCFDRRAEAIA